MNDLKIIDNAVFAKHVKVTKTSLALSKDLPYKEWEHVGRTLQDMGGSINWWLGDWIQYGAAKYGEKYTQAIDETDRAYQTLRNAVYVCEHIDLSRRRDNLSFSVHSEVAKFEPKEQTKWLNKAEKEGLTQKELRQAIKDKKIKDERSEAISDLDIRKGDFKKVLDDVYDIDAIITDPPYPKEYIECFTDLAIFAKTHLKKDGFMAVYSGQYHLPEVIRRLSEHMTYVWTFCLYHTGQNQLVNGVNIMCGWKPVLIFSNGKKKMRFSAYDVVVSEQREKDSHEWQQSMSGVSGLVEIFSKPKDLVVDPFCGSGTFGIVANNLGRRFKGAEIND